MARASRSPRSGGLGPGPGKYLPKLPDSSPKFTMGMGRSPPLQLSLITPRKATLGAEPMQKPGVDEGDDLLTGREFVSGFASRLVAEHEAKRSRRLAQPEAKSSRRLHPLPSTKVSGLYGKKRAAVMAPQWINTSAPTVGVSGRSSWIGGGQIGPGPASLPYIESPLAPTQHPSRWESNHRDATVVRSSHMMGGSVSPFFSGQSKLLALSRHTPRSFLDGAGRTGDLFPNTPGR
jgi:hypothetical protein